ncbi:SAM-dependent methyltransferase [Streptomyces triticirhizae]|uniref:Cell division protein FtsJ n=1 Tax=Streptomyces triticirhizae TaxID=2483353 RepID=A0A3M2KWA8_9ACTN|nr:SAM-dependent methyltransferase [Streptomyces triticirhizae]RMI28750.1 cell division protein FtsJ [Streptomyces triticirhizae]
MTGSTRQAPVLVSFAEEYFAAVSRELRREAPVAAIERLGPDLAGVTLRGADLGELATVVREAPVVFVKHLTGEAARLPLDGVTLPAVAAEALAVADQRLPAGGELALQCWVSGKDRTGFGSAALFREIADALGASGRAVRRTGPEWVLSACVHDRGVSLGLAAAGEALCGWPGGRVRLARSKDSVSRAEFKLEELISTTDLPIPRRGRAVDLGASPGGWTRILRERGLEVWSVDPGDLAPALTRDPLVHHERTTVGRFLPGTPVRFDLAVNDMRMPPELSCETMLDVARVLRPGALAVVTLKLGKGAPERTVRSCLDLLGRRYEILLARQLHHNRNEVSVVARLAAAGGRAR